MDFAHKQERLGMRLSTPLTLFRPGGPAFDPFAREACGPFRQVKSWKKLKKVSTAKLRGQVDAEAGVGAFSSGGTTSRASRDRGDPTGRTHRTKEKTVKVPGKLSRREQPARDTDVYDSEGAERPAGARKVLGRAWALVGDDCAADAVSCAARAHVGSVVLFDVKLIDALSLVAYEDESFSLEATHVVQV